MDNYLANFTVVSKIPFLSWFGKLKFMATKDFDMRRKSCDMGEILKLSVFSSFVGSHALFIIAKGLLP